MSVLWDGPEYEYHLTKPVHGESKTLWYLTRVKKGLVEQWEWLESFTNLAAATKRLKALKDKESAWTE